MTMKFAVQLKHPSPYYFSIHAGSAYTFTINYKLQLATLKHMGHVARLVGIQGNDLDLLAAAFVPYLNSKQPSSLQTVSSNFL